MTSIQQVWGIVTVWRIGTSWGGTKAVCTQVGLPKNKKLKVYIVMKTIEQFLQTLPISRKKYMQETVPDTWWFFAVGVQYVLSPTYLRPILEADLFYLM